MTNAELIKALRYCADEDKICTEQTNCGYYGKGFFCQDVLLHDAADALEAADKRIAELEKSCSWKAYAALEESIEGYKTRIAELEAQLPKECKWLDEQRGRWIYAKCNLCGKVQDVRSNYCPNCGAKMKGENDEQVDC